MIARFRRENPALFHLVAIQLALFVLSLAFLAIDTRIVSGLNAWVKPIKFEISIAIYAATMAWVIQYLNDGIARRVSLRIALCMYVEIGLILLQAARGVGSHFNVANPFDGFVYGTMGVFILYNTWQVALVLREMLRRPPILPAAYLRGLQCGLASLLVGSFMGMYLSAQKGHTVGAVDGGPGLPFLNWSTTAGDLRAAHFMGLHGIQILIALGAWLGYRHPGPNRDRWVLAVFLVYIGLNAMLFVRAMSGLPVLALP